MEFIREYVFLVAPWCAWFLAQTLKPLFEFVRTGKMRWAGATSSGGMPSSHSSTICALTTVLGWRFGLPSYQFAISFVMSVIVMYDAKGVRRAAGVQAMYLNTIKDDLQEFLNHGFKPETFKTNLGHTGNQVLVGALIGIIVGSFFGWKF